MVFSVMGFGITRIGENSSCNFSQALSIVSQIRWCVKALKKVPLSLRFEEDHGSTVIWWLPDDCLGF